MTERERRVVYPLLFLALGASLRDKLGGSLTAKRIVCQELRIEDEPFGNEPARLLALVGRTETANGQSVGALAINGEVEVNGIVKVNGVVSSRNYAYGDKLIMPAPQRSVISLPDLLQALKEAQSRQPADTLPNAQPPAASRAGDPATTTPPATPPAENSNEAAPTTEHNDSPAPTTPPAALPDDSADEAAAAVKK